MLCKKQSAIIIVNNKQSNLLLKSWLRLFLKKINSSSTPIFKNRQDSGRSLLRYSGSCTPLLCTYYKSIASGCSLSKNTNHIVASLPGCEAQGTEIFCLAISKSY